MKCVLVFLLLFTVKPIFAQNPLLKIVTPGSSSSSTTRDRQFITGVTCPKCTVTINGTPVKVYKTGAFAHEVMLKEGNNSFRTEARLGNKSTVADIRFSLHTEPSEQPVSGLMIEKIKVYPEGNLLLSPGEKIQVEVKAQPGGKVSFMNQELYEMPLINGVEMPGIYRGEVSVLADITNGFKKPEVILYDTKGDSVKKEYNKSIGVLLRSQPMLVRTKGRLSYLKYGLGEDRLGGAKIGYVDSLIELKVSGKVDNNFRVQLAPNVTAYIEDDLVDTMPMGSYPMLALTNKWQVYGDDTFDYVKIALQRRLPYRSEQEINPSRIIVDVYGAINNTNWITQLQRLREIEDVQYTQVSDEVYRVAITLKHKQHWGYFIYYEGNNLVIKVRRPPASTTLKGLVIGVDAGHGGRNTGGVGITGAVEKNLTLDMAVELKRQLEYKGAKVIMTRNKEMFFDNKERILFYRDSLPDILISIHLNSSNDPINAKGTGAFYRYTGFKTLSTALQKRMLELGFEDYGINGSFNFMLNSPTEYPNVLAEILFLSNPAEEEQIVDPLFRKQIAEKMVLAIEDFVNESTNGH